MIPSQTFLNYKSRSLCDGRTRTTDGGHGNGRNSHSGVPPKNQPTCGSFEDERQTVVRPAELVVSSNDKSISAFWYEICQIVVSEIGVWRMDVIDQWVVVYLNAVTLLLNAMYSNNKLQQHYTRTTYWY